MPWLLEVHSRFLPGSRLEPAHRLPRSRRAGRIALRAPENVCVVPILVKRQAVLAEPPPVHRRQSRGPCHATLLEPRSPDDVPYARPGDLLKTEWVVSDQDWRARPADPPEA